MPWNIRWFNKKNGGNKPKDDDKVTISHNSSKKKKNTTTINNNIIIHKISKKKTKIKKYHPPLSKRRLLFVDKNKSLIIKKYYHRHHHNSNDNSNTKLLTTKDLFQSIMAKYINQIIYKKEKNITIQTIQHYLMNKYPQRRHQVTKEAILSCIQNEYPILIPSSSTVVTEEEGGKKKKKKKKKKKVLLLPQYEEQEEQTKLLIEMDDSLFIDETTVILNVKRKDVITSTDFDDVSDVEPSSFSTSSYYQKVQERRRQVSCNNNNYYKLTIHLMCAISSRGLEKLLVTLCNNTTMTPRQTDFFHSLTLPPQVPFQIIIKSKEEFETLFQGQRYVLHSLYNFPSSRLNPVQKCLLKLTPKKELSSNIKTEKDVVQIFKEIAKNVTKEDCQKWIEDYLKHC